jgi:hypothetical protein
MKACVSKAQKQVWAWKEACWREVADLPLDEAIRKRIKDSSARARKLGFTPVAIERPNAPYTPSEPVAAKVAETEGAYGKK